MNLQTLLYFVYSIWLYQMCEHESSSITHEHVNLATLSFIHFFFVTKMLPRTVELERYVQVSPGIRRLHIGFPLKRLTHCVVSALTCLSQIC